MAQTAVITNLNENFNDLSGWTGYDTPPFRLMQDAGRTVIGATNATADSVISRSDFPVVNVANGPLSVRLEYRQALENDTSPPQFDLYKKASDPVVPGHIAFVQLFPRGLGNLEFRVHGYTNAAGDTAVIVNVITNQSLPTAFFTLQVTRAANGVWSATRSDTGAALFEAKENPVATGGRLGQVILRDRAYSGDGQTHRYFDNLTIISTTVGEPEAGGQKSAPKR
jgi:hypothetical protein